MINIWYKVRGYLAGGVAFITCPCHLLLTLPLLLALTAGTAAGAFLERNTVALVAISTALFVGGLVLSSRWLGRRTARARREQSDHTQIAERSEEGVL